MPLTEGTFRKRWLKEAIWNGYTWRLEGLTQDEESVTETWKLMHDDNTGEGENSSRRRRNEEAEDEGRGRTRQRLEGSDEMNSRRSAGREGHEEGRDRGAGHAGEQDRTTEPRGSSVAPEGRDLGLV